MAATSVDCFTRTRFGNGQLSKWDQVVLLTEIADRQLKLGRHAGDYEGALKHLEEADELLGENLHTAEEYKRRVSGYYKQMYAMARLVKMGHTRYLTEMVGPAMRDSRFIRPLLLMGGEPHRNYSEKIKHLGNPRDHLSTMLLSVTQCFPLARALAPKETKSLYSIIGEFRLSDDRTARLRQGVHLVGRVEKTHIIRKMLDEIEGLNFNFTEAAQKYGELVQTIEKYYPPRTAGQFANLGIISWYHADALSDAYDGWGREPYNVRPQIVKMLQSFTQALDVHLAEQQRGFFWDGEKAEKFTLPIMYNLVKTLGMPIVTTDENKDLFGAACLMLQLTFRLQGLKDPTLPMLDDEDYQISETDNDGIFQQVNQLSKKMRSLGY